jgi:hypothetical protein
MLTGFISYGQQTQFLMSKKADAYFSYLLYIGGV